MPEHEREAVALALFELASAARAPRSEHASGPIELITGVAERRRIRAGEEAMRAIVRSWDLVPGAVRTLTTGLARDRWLDAARAAAAEADPRSRVAAARFAEDTADPGASGYVSALLRDEQQAVRLHADRAFLRLVMTLLAHVPPERLGEEYGAVATRPTVPLTVDPALLELERVELCRHISDAAWSFADHRCRSPLVGALLVLDRVPGGVLERSVATRIRRLLNEKNHPSHSPLRTVLRQSPSPLLRERALRWLAIEPMSGTCVDRLSAAESAHEHEVTLTRAYLALRPGRGDRLRAVRATGSKEHAPVPSPETLATLSVDARVGAVRFARLIGLDEQARRLANEPTLADAEPRVRLAGAHAAHPADLTDFAFDTDGGVARSAALKWSTLGLTPPGVGSGAWSRRSEFAGLLLRSPHAEVRALAAGERDRLDPFAGTPGARVAARRLLERDPIAFVRAVRERFEDAAGVMPAIMLVRALGVASRFETDLVDMGVNHAEERVRATAVAALGPVDSDAARRVVFAAVRDPEPRVRSNALETGAVSVGTLLEYKDDASHRVRGTALRCLLDNRTTDSAAAGVEALARMLTDEREGHRLAGAWAAERVLHPSRRDDFGPAWRTLVRRVLDAAEGDANERVRWRAARCVRRLETPAGSAA